MLICSEPLHGAACKTMLFGFKFRNFHFLLDYCSFDESQILLYFIQKFTARTSGLLKTEPKICEMFLQLLIVSKPLYNGHKTPQQAAIYQVLFISTPDLRSHISFVLKFSHSAF